VIDTFIRMARKNDGSKTSKETEAAARARRLIAAGVIPLPLPKPTPPPRPVPTDMERFENAWRAAWWHTVGYEAKPLLPWKQVTLRSDEEGRRSYEFWAPKKDIVADLLDPHLTSKRKCQLAWYFDCDPGWGRKGINATAAGLWQARGDSTKEGLMLCHAFRSQVSAQGRRGYGLSPLASLVARTRLPSLDQVGLSAPWHRNSVQMLPGGIFDVYDHFCTRAQFTEASEDEKEMSLHDLAKIVLTEFLLSSRDHELVCVDVIRGEFRDPKWQAVYEHAEQFGDKADPDPNPNNSAEL
jgi:hypothetical protein